MIIIIMNNMRQSRAAEPCLPEVGQSEEEEGGVADDGNVLLGALREPAHEFQPPRLSKAGTTSPQLWCIYDQQKQRGFKTPSE